MRAAKDRHAKNKCERDFEKHLSDDIHISITAAIADEAGAVQAYSDLIKKLNAMPHPDLKAIGVIEYIKTQEAQHRALLQRIKR